MRSPTTLEVILSIGCLFGAFFWYEGCNNRWDTDKLIKDLASAKAEAQHYKTQVNGQPVDVAFNQSILVESKKQLQALMVRNDTLLKLISKFKKLSGTTIINQYTTIKGDTIALKGDSIPCDFKPFQVRRDSVYYHFTGTVGPDFFSIDSLAIPNKQSIVVGERKLGFLKGTERRIEIVNSNPLVHTDKIQNYVIQDRKKWWQRPGLQMGLAFLAGSMVTMKLTGKI